MVYLWDEIILCKYVYQTIGLVRILINYIQAIPILS